MKTKVKKQKKLWQIVAFFIGVCLVSYIGGYFFGRTLGHMKNEGVDFIGYTEMIKSALGYAIPYIYGILIIAEVMYCVIRIRKAKKIFSGWDGCDEDVIQSAEYAIDACGAFSNVALILELFLFPTWVACLEYAPNVPAPLRVAVSIFYFLGFGVTICIQRAAIQLEKKINPEKHGELLDRNFQKEWLSTYDEAQKKMVGQAAFTAFSAANNVCMFLWIASLIGILILDFGIAPVAFVTIIWLTLQISFQKAAKKLEYGEPRKKEKTTATK